VSPVWDDLNARSRGLSTHLLTAGQLDTLARSPDLASLAAELRRVGFIIEEETGAAAPAALELAARRWAAAFTAVLARWAGPRAEPLAVLFEEEDRRSLRAILRGAVQGVAAEQRLAGLIPTPALPERALSELARQPTPAAVATLLVAWRNPYGSPLLPLAATAHPDLARLELTLARSFAARILKTSRRAGGILRTYAAESIDLENVAAAIVLSGAGDAKDMVPKQWFLPGGARVSIQDFEEAVACGEPGLAANRLAAAFGRMRYADALRRRSAEPLEEALLAARIARLRRLQRLSPLGVVPVLLAFLRLRALVLDLQRIIWGVALGAPASAVTEALVTTP